MYQIYSPSLGYLVTYDPLGHEWDANKKVAFSMPYALAKTRLSVLHEAGFTDASIVPPVDLTTLPVYGLAALVRKDWGPNVNFAARPYLAAMSAMTAVEQSYGADSGKSIISYFLGNAGTWRGETAKAVKKELNRRLKAK